MKRDHVRVFMMGGMGNRFFQLAHALAIKDYGIKVELIELPIFVEKLARKFNWSFHEQWIDCKRIGALLGMNVRTSNPAESAYICLYYIAKKIFKYEAGFDNEIGQDNINQSIRIGYFQSLKHTTKDSMSRIAKAITIVLGIKRDSHHVLHVRGGDFNLEDRLSKDKFINILMGDKKITIVTNDKKYVRTIAGDLNTVNFASGISAREDFIHIASASVIYPSDSTFGFWAALIGKQLGAKIIPVGTSDIWSML